jgi:hypothetical protein
MWKTIAALVVVTIVLVTPSEITHLTPLEFVRLPIEAILAAALLISVREKARKPVAIVLGVLLGTLAVIKLTDLGFSFFLDRPFNPIGDWPFLEAAVEFVRQSYGKTGAIVALAVTVVLAVGLMALMTFAVSRLAEPLARHRDVAARAVAISAVVWFALAALGLPSAAHPFYDRVDQVHAGLKDRDAFAEELKVDPYRDVPGGDLLNALRGKDVLLVYVESYGRVAVDDPGLAPRVDSVLDAGNRRLRAAGFQSRTAFLTSPTAGGGSWLAHDTLLTGLWVNSQQRHNDLLGSDRMTLNRAFGRAGWRTVGLMPAVSRDWPEGRFFGYDKLYTGPDLGYAGPKFAFGSIPDQYTLSYFQRQERAAPGHQPVMAEIPLVSSHAPWDPIPPLIGWGDVGDGSVYHAAAGSDAMPEAVFQRDRTEVRIDYAESIEYSLNTLLSYVETYGDDNLVVIFLGDHQPAPIVAGLGAGRDAPISILARDPAVLSRIDSWGWESGIKPDSRAPVWRMDAFRDRFLTAFAH